jgi:5'-nucleotidase / UDP-sugar diphosphatase
MKSKILFFLLLLTQQIVFAQPSKTTANEKKLTILYTNDLHAHLEPYKDVSISESRMLGGFANIATLVRREKATNPNTVYFDAGDFFTGPYISSLTKGEAVIDVMNYLSLDAACIGNHEFDHGWQNVQMQFAKAKFPILNGNIFLKNTNKLIWDHPYKIIIVNGIRIGVIGLHGKFAFYDTIADEMIQGVETKDEEYYLTKYIKQLRRKTDLIVLLIHQGIPGRQSSTGTADVARNLQKDIELAQKIPGVDVIVTGHAHQGTPQPLVSNGTLIISTDAYTVQLGKLEIAYNKKSDKITDYKNTLNYLYDDEVADDSATLNAINSWKQKVKTITNEKVCNTSMALTRLYGEESLLGNMVADAMLYAFPENDFALTNSGGLRQDIDAGEVTVGNLISAFPFPNTVVQLELKGSNLKTLFEHGAGLTNGILQVSKGVEVVYDEQKPSGSRIVLCKIRGQLLDNNKTYKVLTSNFLADGGDGFLAFKKAESKKKTNVEILQTMIAYLKTFATYIPKLEGRVRKL